MNLLSNAVKYTPEGGTIHFTIRELPYEREGYALFQTVVEDTGIGISKVVCSLLGRQLKK